jgi:hypothetical protein
MPIIGKLFLGVLTGVVFAAVVPLASGGSAAGS